MTEIERKAALSLRPYMGENPVVFDVGSNKGDWSAVMAGNVSEMHLFEPNVIFNHYSQVRFCDHPGMHYNALAVFSEAKELPFYYFTNSNNGLSSVFHNQLWVDMGLPMKYSKVQSITLDQYCASNNIQKIDLLKIDVEGADVDVLIGAKSLLEKKAIRFIQIEYSNHIALSGRSFDDAVKLVELFGYCVWHFNGNEFEKATGDLKQYNAENFYIMDQHFTQDWNGEFKRNTQGMKVNFALEIGSFEGLTSCYICDNMLTEGGRIICVDPLTDEYLPGHEDNHLFVGQYERFIRNTKGRPVELMRMTSNEAFASKGFSDYRFDFIYIDGDHRREQVYKDGLRAFDVCRVGGHILFDDYQWRNETKEGIDQCLRDLTGFYELRASGYQIMIKKNANRV